MPTKTETRRLAAELGLWTANKPDSQEICFTAHAGGYHQFLREVTPDAFQRGEIRDTQGRVLGEHHGIALYTIGQRRRLGINTDGKPMFVLRILPEENAIIVGDEKALYEHEMIVGNVEWSSISSLDQPLRAMVKIRYNAPAVRAMLFPLHEPTRVRVVFDQPVRAITPGQFGVFYRGETVVGGGVIEAPHAANPDAEATDRAVKRALQIVQPFLLEGAEV
jgi:tRNA-specific 2-thiouridylase